MKPNITFLRQYQILGDKKKGIDPIIPVSKSTWWAGIKEGRYPAPVKIGKRAVAWKASEIEVLAEQFGRVR